MWVVETAFQALLYVPLVLGIFLSFRVLRLTDLTADGSFVLGAGLYARLSLEGIPYYACLLAGVLGGFCVGVCLAVIQRNNRIQPLLASIICVFMLYSINMLVMGCPNISLLCHATPFSTLMDTSSRAAEMVLSGTVLLLSIAFLYLLQSKAGLILRAFGVNYRLTQRQGYQPEKIRILGLGLSNALYATSGLLCAQIQKFADINMGVGVALVGIGSVMIGAQLFRTLHVISPDHFEGSKEVLSGIIGIFVYFLLMNLLLNLSINPLYLKLVLGMLLIVAFGYKTKGAKYAAFH